MTLKKGRTESEDENKEKNMMETENKIKTNQEIEYISKKYKVVLVLN
jgi:hypothetical protein